VEIKMNKKELEKYLDNSQRYYAELLEEFKKDWKRKENYERNNLSSRTDLS
jgi:hypothetical protein